VEPITITTTSVEQTSHVGELLGALLHPGDLVLLLGDLGSGKTHLAKGIVSGMGSADMVTSPSFVLVNEYRASPAFGGITIYHADLYRLDDPDEVLGIGLEEAWSGGAVALVEWGERAGTYLPHEHLAVTLAYVDETTRDIAFAAQGQRYNDLLASLTPHLSRLCSSQ
jgi:tRNA threonylcarbamoyladenosine biosynthesis protein TsaE